MSKKNKPREKSERELQEEIKTILLVIASKLGAKSEDIGRALGVDGSRIRHILRGSEKKNVAKKRKRKN